MKTRLLFGLIGVLAIGAGLLLMVYSPSNSPRAALPAETSHELQRKRVPAYQDISQLAALPATLAPSNFAGKARNAYAVAQEIPETLAQLPCYCHCDESFGHKSLHTCFVDDHAAHCAVCVDEALLAYRLQKEEKMTPERVREMIVEKYSTDN